MEVPVDSKDDKTAWQKSIEEEFNDLKEEYDESFELEMQQYQIEMEKWTASRHETRQVSKRRQDENKSDSEADSGTDENDTDIKRPKSPAKFDAEGTIKAIEKRLVSQIRCLIVS